MSKIQWECDLVEQPFCRQLQAMGWQWIEGDTDVPEFTERQNFREVLLKDRLAAALRKLNLRDGRPWLDEDRIRRLIDKLEKAGGHRLMEVNESATRLLLKGTKIDGLPDWNFGRNQAVRFIDFENSADNDFLVINQFKVELTSGRGHVIPEAYLEWADTSPVPLSTVAEELGVLPRSAEEPEAAQELATVGPEESERCGTPLFFREREKRPEVLRTNTGATVHSQQILTAGMLRPAHLLDLIRNFTVFQQVDGKTRKVMAHYQQFRAVHKAVGRLQEGRTKGAGRGTRRARRHRLAHAGFGQEPQHGLPRPQDANDAATEPVQGGVTDLQGQVDVCVQVLEDLKIRADFINKLRSFYEMLSLLEHRPEVPANVFRDAKLLGFINKVAANLYRDPALNLFGVAEKVKALINEHVSARGIDPKIPPTVITDADFEKVLQGQGSSRARAAQMQHAARYYIIGFSNQNPVYADKMSKRLEEILQRFKDDWDALERELRKFIDELKQGDRNDFPDLDAKVQVPFVRLVLEECGKGRELSEDRRKKAVTATIEIVERIQLGAPKTRG